MEKIFLTASLMALMAAAPINAQEAEKPAALGPTDYVNGAEIGEWVQIDAADLLVMDLTPDRDGNARRVIIHLMPEPFSQGWVRNIRKLAAAKWWDGTSVNRVQDNYVVQWGDAPETEGEDKALPEGLETLPESGYAITEDKTAFQNMRQYLLETARTRAEFQMKNNKALQSILDGDETIAITKQLPPLVINQKDPYAGATTVTEGWPIGISRNAMWPVHCYGAVGVGRGYSPDTGSGAELYTVIGHAPRHLDQNIAVVGRVIEGIEHLSSLPRGTGPLGFYESAEERVQIQSIRLGSELDDPALSEYRYLSTESQAFAKYADARANRRDPFFIVPAGGADICNIPVPVKRWPAGE